VHAIGARRFAFPAAAGVVISAVHHFGLLRTGMVINCFVMVRVTDI
jgi:hypothetical protein